jgi:hypothetical protein
MGVAMTRGKKRSLAVLLTPEGRFDFDTVWREVFAAQQSVTVFAYCKRNFGAAILEGLTKRNAGYLEEMHMGGNPVALEAGRLSAINSYADMERITSNAAILSIYAAAESIAKTAVHIACDEKPDEVGGALHKLASKLSIGGDDRQLLSFVDGDGCGFGMCLRVLESLIHLSSVPAIPSRLNSVEDTWKYDQERLDRLGEERRNIAHENLLRISDTNVDAECGYVGDFLLAINQWLNVRFDRGRKATS